jgi:hypothetical protein
MDVTDDRSIRSTDARRNVFDALEPGKEPRWNPAYCRLEPI